MYYLPDQLIGFESIIDETQKEHNDFKEKSLQVQKAKKHLFLLNLSKKLIESNLNITHIEVGAHNVFEVNEMANDYVFSRNSEDCTFLSVEIFLPTYLRNIFIENKFNASISVCHGKICLSKTLSFTETVVLKEIIPLNEPLLDCQVHVIFFGRINERNVTLKIPPVAVDISYYLMSGCDKKNSKVDNKIEKLVNLSSLYSSFCKKKVLKEYYLKHQMSNPLGQQCFIEKMLKNSYKHVDLQKFIFDDKEVLHIQNKDLQTLITYNIKSNTIILESNIFSLHRLKRYFLRELEVDESIEKSRFEKLVSFNTSNYETLVEAYKALRNS